jgi:hypothetical protein
MLPHVVRVSTVVRMLAGAALIVLAAHLLGPSWDAPDRVGASTQEVVALVAGCNPVAITYPDATPIETIASAVSPPEILISIWEFDMGVWLGYSPQFPEVSDLTHKNFLDVAFLCVTASGTFTRPEI